MLHNRMLNRRLNRLISKEQKVYNEIKKCNLLVRVDNLAKRSGLGLTTTIKIVNKLVKDGKVKVENILGIACCLPTKQEEKKDVTCTIELFNKITQDINKQTQIPPKN